jgi:Zn-dependent peptidase ImmA (M78 family)
MNSSFKYSFKVWCENVSLRKRKELRLQPADPLDPKLLARSLAAEVWTPEQVPNLDRECLITLVSEDPKSWSAVTLQLGSKHLIIVNSTHSAARRASSLMHELSHLLMSHRPARVDVSEDGLLMLNTYSKRQEDEAHWLAGCLLLPREALKVITKSAGDNLKAAARRYGVSLPMLRYRMNVTGSGVRRS